jgi:hypothetical protein
LPGSHKVYTLKLLGDTAFYANGLLVHDLCGASVTGNGARVPSARFQPDNNSETRGQEARATISTR